MSNKIFRNALTALCLFTFFGSAVCQQLGHVDLTHVPADDLRQHAEEATSPDPCEGKWNEILALAFVEAKKPQKITLEITRLSTTPVALGSEIDAEVRLKNSSKDVIEIPWSTAPSAFKQTSYVNPVKFETGNFEFHLSYEDGTDMVLKSHENTLYSSNQWPDSRLRLPPGAWMAATLRFRLESDSFGVAHTGRGRLTVKWKQGGVSRFEKNCRLVQTTYFYRTFYRQEMKVRKMKIVKDDMLALGQALKHYNGGCTDQQSGELGCGCHQQNQK